MNDFENYGLMFKEEDYDELDVKFNPTSRPRKKNKYERRFYYRRKLMKKLNNNGFSPYYPVYYCDGINLFGKKVKEPRIVRYYPKSSGETAKFFCKYANRVVRRNKDEIQDGNYYRKMYDLWWTID